MTVIKSARTTIIRGALYLHAMALMIPIGMPSVQAAEGPATLLSASRIGKVGTRAPAFKMETIDGDTIDLADLYGKKAVYLKLWATWCIPCRQQMPHFENTYENAGDDLAVIAINAGFNETLQDILDFREDYGIHMPIVVDDGTIAGTFNLRITPLHIVIGKDGMIKHIGQKVDDDLEQALQEARSEPARQLTDFGKLGDSGSHFDVGDMLPAQTLTTSSGDKFMLRDANAGENTVLVFMIPWCESYLGNSRPKAGEICRQEREQVETLKQQAGNVRWLGINSGLWTLTPDLAKYQEQYNTTLPMALDDDSILFRAFGVMTVPTVIVADASGKIVKRIEGYDAGLGQVLSSL